MNKNPGRVQQMARQLHDRFWRGLGLPVDPVVIARGLGIVVREEPLPAHLAGGIVKGEVGAPVMILNSADARDERRFTCAHEIGHHVLNTDVVRFDITDRREDVRPTMVMDEAELNANAFAAYLLIPEDQMSTHATEDAWLTASFFDVPQKIVEWRRTLPESLWLRHIVAARMPHGRIERRGADIDPHG